MGFRRKVTLMIKNLFKFGIRKKVIIAFTLFLILNIAPFSWITIGQGKRVLERGIIKRGISLTRNLAYNAEYGVLIKNKDILFELIEGVIREEDVVFATILDRKARILVHKGEDIAKKEFIGTRKYLEERGIELNSFSVNSRDIFYEFVLPVKTTKKKSLNKEELLYEETDRRGKEEIIGKIRVGISLENMNRESKRIIKSVFYFILSVIVFGVLIIIISGKIVLGPIEQLALANQKISRGDSVPRIKVKSKDEIGELTRSFNQMTNNLKRKDKEIKKYTDKLEKSVEEREKTLSELATTQSQLVQSEKLAGIGILASGVAHEINNPLQGVFSKVNRILRKINDEKVVRDSAEKIKKYAEKMAEIVKELSKYSRDAGNESDSTVDLNTVMEESLKMASFSRDFIDISVKKEWGDIPTVPGNAGQMQQIFVNLITNAMDAMEGKGDLTLRTGISTCSQGGELSCQQGKSENMIFAEIADTGCGIEEETLSQIFNPFFSTKEAGKGTGLGLSMAHILTNKYRGDIGVKSRPGGGTTFKVSFPLN